MIEIERVLRRYPPDCQPTRIEPLGSAGGMSGAQFWRITARRGDSVVRGSRDPAQERSLVLRCWPREHPAPDRLRFIHAVLGHANRRGITILPVPITTRDGQSFVHHADHLWELAPWMAGTADYERSPRVEKLRAAMTALAEFHVATVDFADVHSTLSVGRQAESTPQNAASSLPALKDSSSPAIHRCHARIHQLARGGADELFRAVTSTIWPELTPLARQFLAALPNAFPRAIAQLEPLARTLLPLQPCLRDIWHDHVLFTGDEVTGFVDFGAIEIDTPACDIARLLGSLVGDDATGWQTGIAAYSAVRPLSVDESPAVTALDISGTVLAGCNWIRWIYVEGRDFENRIQVIKRFGKIVARLTHGHD